jgi:hypothetical protein|tara:strand:+ start:810 stop:1694 length:885 start_codon:yes stop_codon:yes gene_type:complete
MILNRNSQYDKGFVIVASMHSFYKNSALTLIDSLDEYYPDCKIFVVTHKEWADEFKHLDQVVDVVSDDMPNSVRAKLWALRHSPFEKSCYLDADMEICDEQISDVWDLLDDDHDVAFGVINPPNGNSTAIYNPEYEARIRDNNVEKHLRYHGGFFVWNNTEAANKAMWMWWDQYVAINCNKDWWETTGNELDIARINIAWDQFTWWWIMKYDIPELKMQEIGDEAHETFKWNANEYLNDKFINRDDIIIKHSIINRDEMSKTEALIKRDELDSFKREAGGRDANIDNFIAGDDK